MSDNFTHIRRVIKPAQLSAEETARLGEALGQRVAAQASLGGSKYILRVAGAVEEDDHSFLIRHEPAIPAKLARVERVEAVPSLGELPELAHVLFSALREAHSAAEPLIHGGLCPGCVLIDESGQWKVTDFGIGLAFAKVLGGPEFKQLALTPSAPGDQAAVTGEWEWVEDDRTDRQCRIVGYISPEQWQDPDPVFSVETDLFSLGVMLYEQIAGVHPYYPDGDRADYYQWEYMWSCSYVPLEQTHPEWSKLFERYERAPTTLSAEEQRFAGFIQLVNRVINRRSGSRILTVEVPLDVLPQIDPELEARLANQEQRRQDLAEKLRHADELIDQAECAEAREAVEEIKGLAERFPLAGPIDRLRRRIEAKEEQVREEEARAAKLIDQMQEAVGNRKGELAEKLARQALAIEHAGQNSQEAAEQLLAGLDGIRELWGLEDRSLDDLKQARERLAAAGLDDANEIIRQVLEWAGRAGFDKAIKAEAEALATEINGHLQVRSDLERARDALYRGEIDNAEAFVKAVHDNRFHSRDNEAELQTILATTAVVRGKQEWADAQLRTVEANLKIGEVDELNLAKRCCGDVLATDGISAAQAALGKQYLERIEDKLTQLEEDAKRGIEALRQAEHDLAAAKHDLAGERVLEAEKLAQELSQSKFPFIQQEAEQILAAITESLDERRGELEQRLDGVDAQIAGKLFSKAIECAREVAEDNYANDAIRARAHEQINTAELAQLKAEEARQIAVVRHDEALNSLRRGLIDEARKFARNVLDNSYADSDIRASAERVLKEVELLEPARKLIDRQEFPQAVRLLSEVIGRSDLWAPIEAGAEAMCNEARGRGEEILLRSIQCQLELRMNREEKVSEPTLVSAQDDLSGAAPGWVKANLDQLESFIHDCHESGQGLGPTEALAAGETLGQKYEIIECLGRGGMGEVYRVRDLVLEREVVIKLSTTFAESEVLAEALRNEARAIAALNHPHIIHINTFDVYDGRPCFETDYIRGRDLAEHARQQELSGQQIAELLIPIAEALTYAHSQGVLHRDVKPQNIYVGEDPAEGPWLIDFGLAKMRSMYDRRLNTGLCGTPGYIAPEVITSMGQNVDQRADIFALGCVLYWLLAKETPFQNSGSATSSMGPSISRMMLQTLRSQKKMLSQVAADAPGPLRRICDKAMATDPSERYQEAREFADDLKQFLQDLLYRRAESDLGRAGDQFESRRRGELAELEDLEAVAALAKSARDRGSDVVRGKSVKLMDQVRQVRHQISRSQKEALKQFEAARTALKARRSRAALSAARSVQANAYVPELHPEAGQIADQARALLRSVAKRVLKAGAAVCAVLIGAALVHSYMVRDRGPQIDRQPQAQQLAAGARAEFSVHAKGRPVPGYQWKRRVEGEWVELSGETAATLIIESVTEDNQGEYLCVISGGDNEIASEAVTLIIFRPRPMLVIAAASPVMVREGATARFSVKLSGRPGSPMTVTIARQQGDPDIGISSGVSLTFDANNYATPQEVTLSASNDADNVAGETTFRISGPGLEPALVTVREIDKDKQALMISARSLSILEGSTAEFTISLTAAPLGPLTVMITREQGDEGITVQTGGSLTFDSRNYSAPQTVRLSVGEDADRRNGKATFKVGAPGMDPVRIEVKAFDKHILVVSRKSLSVPEGAGQEFTVTLADEPASPITITVSKEQGDADLTVTRGAKLSFDGSNYGVAQTVVLSAADDADAVGSKATFRIGGPGLEPVRITAKEVDDDTMAMIVSAKSLIVAEGKMGHFTVALTADPVEPFTVNVSRESGGDADLTIGSGASLTFDSSNYSEAQTVTLSAADDADRDNGQARFRIGGSGLDPVFIAVEEQDKDVGMPAMDWTAVRQTLAADAGADWLKIYADKAHRDKIELQVNDREQVTVRLTYPWATGVGAAAERLTVDKIEFSDDTWRGNEQDQRKRVAATIRQALERAANGKSPYLMDYVKFWRERQSLENELLRLSVPLGASLAITEAQARDFLAEIARIKCLSSEIVGKDTALTVRIKNIRNRTERRTNNLVPANRFVEYFWGPQYVHAVFVFADRNKISAHLARLGRSDEIAKQIAALFSGDGKRLEFTDKQAAAEKLGDVVLRDFVGHKSFFNSTEVAYGIVVAPDGPLFFVPLSSLPFRKIELASQYKLFNPLGSLPIGAISRLGDMCRDEFTGCSSAVWTYLSLYARGRDTRGKVLQSCEVPWKLMIGKTAVVRAARPRGTLADAGALLMCAETDWQRVNDRLDEFLKERLRRLAPGFAFGQSYDAGFLAPRVPDTPDGSQWFIAISDPVE